MILPKHAHALKWSFTVLLNMQVRKGHSKIYQQDIIDVLDKQLLEGMVVLLTEEELQKCEKSVFIFTSITYQISGIQIM